ncbi:MAG: ABC transporter substrate-binding protein, partial [Treponema sp.]|nr:ABC transporter substrate-binding protein [Treponema sp.]
LAQQRKVVLITPTGTNPKVTDAGDFIFRACFIDPFQGVAAADFASANLKARRAVILFDAGADYNSGLAGEFRKQFLKNGGQIVADEGYQSGDVDFNAQITRIKGANPDVVYLPNYYNDAALQGSQLRSQGISCAILGCDGWPGIEGAAGPDFPPAYWSTGFARDTTDPRGVAFVKAFEAANPHTYAESQAAHGYDSVMIIANAIKAAGTLDTVAVKDAMAKTDGDYITGHIRYDAHRDPIKAATILEIVKRDNKLVNVYSTTINPK